MYSDTGNVSCNVWNRSGIMNSAPSLFYLVDGTNLCVCVWECVDAVSHTPCGFALLTDYKIKMGESYASHAHTHTRSLQKIDGDARRKNPPCQKLHNNYNECTIANPLALSGGRRIIKLKYEMIKLSFTSFECTLHTGYPRATGIQSM